LSVAGVSQPVFAFVFCAPKTCWAVLDDWKTTFLTGYLLKRDVSKVLGWTC
jgi:hypothetical protein